MLHVLLVILVERPTLDLLGNLVLEHGLENRVLASRLIVGLDSSSIVEVVEWVGGDLGAPVAVPRGEDRVGLVLLLLKGAGSTSAKRREARQAHRQDLAGRHHAEIGKEGRLSLPPISSLSRLVGLLHDLGIPPQLVNLVLEVADEGAGVPLFQLLEQLRRDALPLVPLDRVERDVELGQLGGEVTELSDLEVDSARASVVSGVVGGGEDVEDDEREGVGPGEVGSVGERAIVVDAKVLVAADAEKDQLSRSRHSKGKSTHRIQ